MQILNNDIVSTIHKCQSKIARRLCVYDIAFKLQQSDKFDIGGVYTEAEPDMWFYYTTSLCPGFNYLLNLFVCVRKPGNYSIGVSNSNEIFFKKSERSRQCYLTQNLTWQFLKATQPDENIFIKTYNFNEDDLKNLQNQTFYIPISIHVNSTNTFNSEVVKRIKINHDFGDLLTKQEKTDFVLESVSRKQFHVHRIILAAHSPVLRNLIKNTSTASSFLDINDNDMELLLQFMYTGTIQDLLKQDCLKLLEIADRFQLKNLFLLTQLALTEQINVKNAVDIAILSEKYHLEKLQFSVFNFIKTKPEVFSTEGWGKLNDVQLAKKLFQFMQTNKYKDD